MPLLQVENVYSTNTSAHEPSRGALQGLSFSVEAGEFIILIGRSGGGKTTLLRLLNRLDDPVAGSVCFSGRPVNELPPAEVRRSIVMLAQRPVLFSGTVIENVLLPLRLHNSRITTEQQVYAVDVLKRCQVPTEWHRLAAKELSVGQQQRVALARAMVLQPSLLVADEPTSALDRPTARQVAQSLRDYTREGERAALMVSHDLSLAADYGDRILFLEHGVIHEEGNAKRLLHSPQSEALRSFLDYQQDRISDD